MSKILKALGLSAGLIIVFWFLQIGGTASRWNVDAPFVAQKVLECGGPNDQDLTGGATFNCACVTTSVPEKGFPFRTNLYDACRQNGADLPAILIANFIIAAALAAGIIFATKQIKSALAKKS